MNAWQGILVFTLVLAAFLWLLRKAALIVYTRTANALPKAGSEAPAADTPEDEELAAILAAAAEVVLGRRVRLKRLRFLHTAGSSAWAVTGRLNIMASHLVRKGNL